MCSFAVTEIGMFKRGRKWGRGKWGTWMGTYIPSSLSRDLGV